MTDEVQFHTYDAEQAQEILEDLIRVYRWT